MTSAPPLYQGIIGLAISLAPAAIAIVLVYRRRTTELTAATGLVYWGILIVVMEHGTFGLDRFGGHALRTHTGFHFQMLATYGLVAFALVAVVVAPLIREGHRMGWLGLLVVVVIGVGGEIPTAFVTTPHGVPPRFWSWGLFLWGYPMAWVAALVLSFRPIFRSAVTDAATSQPQLERSV
ncbi:MAG: hypothetical protein WCE80_01240 [Acidimicrobiia bacterium]